MPGVVHNKCCNEFGLVVFGMGAFMSMIVFMGGFFSSDPGSRGTEVVPHAFFLPFGLISSITTLLTCSDKYRSRRVIYYVWNFFALSSLPCAGAVLFSSAYSGWESGRCELSTDNQCAKSTAEFVGSLIYSLCMVVTNIIMIFISDLDPVEKSTDEGVKKTNV